MFGCLALGGVVHEEDEYDPNNCLKGDCIIISLIISKNNNVKVSGGDCVLKSLMLVCEVHTVSHFTRFMKH